jgi:XTP/dITP diphosphohydrolase
MMMLPERLVLATRNRKKLAEMAAILADLPVTVLSSADFPDLAEVVEDTGTFEGNAAKKALQTADGTGLWAVADDSGLEVDALGGLPGVDSAYFAGRPGDDDANNAKLIADLAGVPDDRRTARYRCVIALARPGQVLFTVADAWEGRIARAPRGSAGFGYDPYFVPEGYAETVAELDPALKNRISHRAKALAKFRARLTGM